MLQRDRRVEENRATFRSDVRAASSLVSVILLVGVVVVVGSSVVLFGFVLADSVSEPSATADFAVERTATGIIELRHTDGDSIDGDNLVVKGGEATVPETVQAGQTVEVVPSSDTVRLVWRSDDGRTSNVLDQVSSDPHPLAATGGSVTRRIEPSSNFDYPDVRAVLVTDATLYTGDVNLVALDSESANRKWAYAYPGGTVDTIAKRSDTIYVHASGAVAAVNASTGQERWSEQIDDSRSMSVGGETVYVGSWDGELTALNASDGSRRWQQRFAGSFNDSINFKDLSATEDGVYMVDQSYEKGYHVQRITPDGSVGRSASDGVYDYRGFPDQMELNRGTLYFARERIDDDDPGIVFAVDVNDSDSMRWRHTHHDDLDAVEGLAVSEGVVYSISRDGEVVAADASDGSELWSKNLDLDANVGALEVHNGSIYVSTWSGDLVVVEPTYSGS